MVSAAQQNLINATLSPAQTGVAISTSVAAKTLDAARQQGAAIVQLLDSASSIGDQGGIQAGDPLVAKATGLGNNLDIMA